MKHNNTQREIKLKKIVCFFLGHDDPAIELGYEIWRDWDRDCLRCGKALKPKITLK